MPNVTPDDVAAGWRPLTTEEIAVATQQIIEAAVILQAMVPGLDSKPDDLVKLVIVRMVRRYMKNPEGWRSATTSIDDFSETMVRDSAISSGDMTPWDVELGWLGIRKTGAFEIRLGGS